MEAGNQSEGPEPVCGLSPLQNGIIRTIKGLLKQGDWLLKLDLKDAYLTVPIHQDHRRFLCFQWQGQTWQFKVLPFGLTSAPLIFTKITKPIVSTLCRLGIRMSLCLDDMLLMADSVQEARAHLRAAIEILVALGFVINMGKSTFQPSQKLEFLGFCIDTRNMMLSLPHRRLHSLQMLARQILAQKKATIRLLARLLGMMVAAHPAVLPAPLHFRSLERVKMQAARRDPTYTLVVSIPPTVEMELEWWVQTSQKHNGRPLQIRQWDLMIETCIPDGMGNQLSRTQHRGPLDRRGAKSAHQLLRAHGCLPCTESLPPQPGTIVHPTPPGQYHSDSLPESDGRYSLTPSLEASSGDMRMVHSERIHNPCRAPPGDGEHQGRLVVTSPEGFKRLETEQASVPGAGEQAWAFLHRSIRLKNKYPAPGLLQLETQSGSSGGGCPVSGMVLSQPLHASPICMHTSVSDKTPRGSSFGSPHCPSVAKSALVPQGVGVPDRPSDPAPSVAKHHHQYRGPVASISSPGQIPSGRLACVGRSYQAIGLSDRVISILRKPWRGSTESVYSAAWHQWDCWCFQRAIDLLSAPISSILKFQAGKQFQVQPFPVISYHSLGIHSTIMEKKRCRDGVTCVVLLYPVLPGHCHHHI